MLFRLYLKQKASNWTLFAFITLTSFSSPLYADNCTVQQFDETVKVAHVYDGDTLRLVDGRKLRLIGINTPERGRNGKKNEPFYQAAKTLLQKIIKKNNQQINIIFGTDRRDRYKRFLAHIFTLDNKNISAMLLKQGMGYSIAIPPNIQLLACYQNAENKAHTNQRGIWGHIYSNVINVASLKTSTRGFHQVSGKIDRIGESRSSIWLNLNSKSGAKFALRILKKNLFYFKKFRPIDLLNRQVTARGWIYEIKGEQRMSIHHPASIQIQTNN